MTHENIFIQLLIFILVVIQFGSILLSSYSVLVLKIISVLVLLLRHKRRNIFTLILVSLGNVSKLLLLLLLLLVLGMFNQMSTN